MTKEQDELKKKFHHFVRDKKATAKVIKEFLQGANPTVKELTEALKTFSDAQQKGSAAFQEFMKETLAILRMELEKEDITEIRRGFIYERISKLLEMAQQEARENRAFNEKLISAAKFLGLMALGGVILIASKGKNRKL